MSSEKTNKTATYALAGFGGLALVCLILWLAGVFKTPDKDSISPGTEKPLGGSAWEQLYK